MSYDQIPLSAKAKFSCSETEALLSQYIDQELPSGLAKKVQAHVDGCVDCALLRDDLLQIITVARELSETPIPSGVQSRLRKALKERLGLSFTS